jgi:alpha-N-acetylglucosamine transferase
MLTVACVYWKGEWRGQESCYDASWVEKLQHMVDKNLSIPHKFVCFSNTDVPCERIPLYHNWPGWWSKIELFRPKMFEDRVLYLDLDTLLLTNLDCFVNYPSSFAILKAKPRPKVYLYRKEGIEIKRYNSSVMVFDSTVGHDIYLTFNKDIRLKYRSDQDWIGRLYPKLDTFPREWVQKLGDCDKGQPTPEMKIMLCMPKKNNEAAEEYRWIKKLWV